MDITEAREILGDLFYFTAEDTDKIIKQLELPKDAKILDVGTGIGSLAITLALNGYRVLTGEPADDDSVYAKKEWSENAQKVGVHQMVDFKAFNAEDMPFEDGAFDAIICLGSFHHIEEDSRVKVLEECIRTTGADGIICIFEPTEESINMIKQFEPSHPEAADPTEYAGGLDLTSETIAGARFNTYLFRK